jgi:cadmium resistance protein CadD (predicted permease)
VSLGALGQAAVLFVATNVDDMVVLALFFAQGAGQHGAVRRIAAGQYLGFAGILMVSVAGAYGATLLPESAIPYLGILPVVLGLHAAWQAWRDRHARSGADPSAVARVDGPTALAVAAVTFANGGDNVGVYVPVFAAAGITTTGIFVAIFLVLLAGLIGCGRFFATRPVIARALERWGHILLPVVLIGVGLLILFDVQGI